jgi:phospholipid/cholesterol/gamma-HCH transport system substrate-binding protein
MLLRKTKVQLVVFALVSVVALVYALVRFTALPHHFGHAPYTVPMKMADSGGIFTHAEVAYRGLNVGRVGEMRLRDEGLEIDLVIEPDAPQIPADADATVMNRSAIGEQFVNLAPRADGAPYLEDGSVIPVERTKTPPGAEEVIDSSVRLSESLPIESVRTLVSESYDAFSGVGDDLRLLMRTARDFTGQAHDALPATVDLLDHGNAVLKAMNDEADNIKSFSKDLNLLSETLKGSDDDIRALIQESPRSARQLSKVVDEVGPGLSGFIANMITFGELANPRLRGTEQALQTYPALSAGALAVPKDSGQGMQARLGFVLSFWDPPVCVKGYEGTERRPGDDIEDTPHNRDAYCAEPKGSPLNVRGSNNVPFHGVPQPPTDEEVAQHSDRDSESVREQRPDSGSQSDSLAALTSLLGG